jgi:predicted metalloendopeptidase
MPSIKNRQNKEMGRNKSSKMTKRNSQTKTKKLSQSELKLICGKSANTFNQFEKAFEASSKFDLIKDNKNIEQELVKLFNRPFTPSHINQKNDYYTYINYQWIEDQTKKIAKEDKFYVQVDSFRIVQENVYYELIELVKQYINNNRSNKRAKLVKNVYDSFISYEQSTIKTHVAEIVETLDSIIAEGDVYKLLAHVNTNEIVSWGCPIVWTMLPDDKNSDTYRNYISSPRLTLYDYQMYILNYGTKEEQKYRNEFKARYMLYLKDLFTACLGKDHGMNVETIWDIEYELLLAMGSCDDIKNESPEHYNVVKSSESQKLYNFDFALFTKHLGYEKTPSMFITTSLGYIKCGMKIIHEKWSTPEWKVYWYYIYLRQMIRFSKDWSNIHYEFHGKFVRGNPLPFPKELQPVFGLAACFNTLLINEYVDKNKKQSHIDYVHNMAEDLKTIFIRILKRNTWLSPKTKKYALMKLDHLELVVGSPKVLREDPLLDYTSNDAWGNLMKLTEWRHGRFIKLDGEKIIDIPIIDWANEPLKLVGTQAYVVNAYYTPAQNKIYVPLAYLQKPFIDLDERGIEYNLAHIGYTIAHELSHSLDNTGSKYDHKGNLRNWWTPEDAKIFAKKVLDVNRQYETFAKYDGIIMDGSLSSGENLADISGLAICEEYLRDFQEKNEDNVPIKSLSFQGFFVYIAVQARQKIYNKAIKAQLKINPHPMDKYRVNCPLSRLELFRAIYNIKKGDKMYWPSTDTIW